MFFWGSLAGPAMKNGFTLPKINMSMEYPPCEDWLVVSNIFYVHPYLGR